MKKNKFLLLVVFFAVIAMTGCQKREEESLGVPYEEIMSTSVSQEVFETKEIIEDAKFSLSKSNQNQYYAFSMLDEPLQNLYLEILTILENRQENVDVSTLLIEDIDTAFQCVLMDHPELFYVQGYKYTKFTREGTIQRIAVSGTYTMTSEQIESYQIEIDAYVKECISMIGNQTDEYEIVKYIYQYIIANTEYNLTSIENQNICSVFLYQESVCQGYAKAMQYLLNKVGIFCTLVTGTVENGEGHAWNLVRIDGAFYYVDVTWGDAFYEFDSAQEVADKEAMPSINYDYLCVMTDQLSKTHQINNIVPIPRCVSMEANYYVKEGSYFTEFDEAKIGDLFANSYEKGINYITLKSSSYEVYREILDNLIEEQKVFSYLKGKEESIAYTINEKQHTISFWLS